MNSKKENIIKNICKTTKHKGHKNYVNHLRSGFLLCKFKYTGSNNLIDVNNSIFYKCKFHFFGSNNKILIGSNCIFKNVDFWIEGDGNVISIGDGCLFAGTAQLACCEGTSITIGSFLLCSSDVNIRTSDSHSILNLNDVRINNARDVFIGENVWICQKATLLKGSQVPNNSVVAYGSVVTKKYNEENCVYGGNPARLIKQNIKWSKERL